jgi:hypothetical protein
MLGAHGVYADDAPFYFQQLQQMGNGGNFIALGFLTKTYTLLHAPCVDQMKWGCMAKAVF